MTSKYTHISTNLHSTDLPLWVSLSPRMYSGLPYILYFLQEYLLNEANRTLKQRVRTQCDNQLTYCYQWGCGRLDSVWINFFLAVNGRIPAPDESSRGRRSSAPLSSSLGLRASPSVSASTSRWWFLSPAGLWTHSADRVISSFT